MKILLVDPPGKNKGINTGLGYLSAFLKGKHDVRVLDLNNIEIGLCGDPNPDLPIRELEDRLTALIGDFEPDLLGISVKTFTAGISARIIKFLHDHRPALTTVVGGPHITLDGYAYLKENRIDYGVLGEGEYTTFELCRALEDKRGWEDIPGILYWRDGQLVQNPKRETIANLDALPFPSYDHFSSVLGNRGQLKEYPLLTSRGCPYQCSYCSMPQIMSDKWRSHSPSRVIEELEYAKQKYRVASFTVIDDNFTLNLNRVERICDGLISRNVNLTWNSQNGIRADRINPELAEKMKRSGCRHVWIGIESADADVFQKIQKGEELENIEKGIRHLQKAGIRVGGFFIVGLPSSTRDSDLKSLKFVKEHGIEGWWFNFVPYPHTEAWKWVQANGKILRPLDGALQYGGGGIEPVFETDEYPRAVRMKTYEEIHVRGRYFDRLVDPSLRQRDKWRLIFKKVLPYGPGALWSLALAFLKYNAKLTLRKVCQ